MARRKTDEELMLEAELAARAAEIDADGASSAAAAKAHVDVRLSDVEREAGQVAQGAAPRSGMLGRIGPKRLAAVAATVLVIAIAVFVVSRAMFSNSVDVWDGTADTGWYAEGMTSMDITTAEQLAGMRELCNDGVSLEGIRFKLRRNLDLYEIPTKPIGDGRQEGGVYNVFKGSFDGAGHTITGINITEDTWDHAGLFGSASGGDFKGLTVEGKVTGQVRVGGVVGELSGGSLQDCTNRCKVSSIKTATSYYPVSADVGGVCGMWLGVAARDAEQSARLTGLVNEGEVSARACSAGGVIGTIANSQGFTVTVSDLENHGTVTVYCESDDRDEAVGGVVGVVGSFGTDLISNLSNEGAVSCSTVLCVGGVIGALMPDQREGEGASSEGVQLKGLSNAARIAANAQDERAHVGGIVGYLHDPDVTFDDCTNTGELAATNGNADDIAAGNGAEVWDAWEEEHPLTWS